MTKILSIYQVVQFLNSCLHTSKSPSSSMIAFQESSSYVLSIAWNWVYLPTLRSPDTSISRKVTIYIVYAVLNSSADLIQTLSFLEKSEERQLARQVALPKVYFEWLLFPWISLHTGVPDLKNFHSQSVSKIVVWVILSFSICCSLDVSAHSFKRVSNCLNSVRFLDRFLVFFNDVIELFQHQSFKCFGNLQVPLDWYWCGFLSRGLIVRSRVFVCGIIMNGFPVLFPLYCIAKQHRIRNHRSSCQI